MITGATSESVPNGSSAALGLAATINPTPAVSNYVTAMSSPGTDAEDPTASPQRSLECSDVEHPPNSGDVMLLGSSPTHNGGQFPGLMNTFKRELQPSSPY